MAVKTNKDRYSRCDLRRFMRNIWDIAPKFAMNTVKMSTYYKMDPFIENLTDLWDRDGTSTCKE